MSGKITSLSLKDVRCFAGEQHAELSKVTLLVGENSTGKSTFLGCIYDLVRLSGLVELTDQTNYFDQKPFCMGSFENLARSGYPSFRVGIGMEDDRFRRLEIEFEPGHDGAMQERVLELELAANPSHAGAQLRIARETPEGRAERWRFEGPGFEFELDQSVVSYKQFTTWLSQYVRRNVLPFDGDVTRFRKRMGRTTDQELVMFGKFINFFRHQFRASETPIAVKAIDPNGLERRRSYPDDPLGVLDGGTHLEAINNVGRKLDLFNRVDVRERGPHQYEILADVSGVMCNLVDVGYGITNVLPLIKSLMEASRNTLFLLQQPEVHIHPSAQAKLVRIVAESNHTFIVETHSDHVIDWLRIMVTEGNLAASDVGIVYLERRADDPSATRLYQLRLDGSGNLSGQPQNYRQFFSEETARLMGLPV